MRRRGLAWAVVLAMACVGRPASADLPRDDAFLKRVDAAVTKGAEWLAAAHRAGAIRSDLDVQFPGGLPALLYLTLRVCEVPRDDPVCRDLYARMRSQYEAARKARTLRTYSVSVVMMAIAHHGERAPTSRKDAEVELDKDDTAWMRDCVALLESWQRDDGTWWYGRPGIGPDGTPARAARGTRVFGYDHSNLQYALLGLQAASRCGVPVRSKVFQRTLEHLVAAQEPDGPVVPRTGPDAKGATHDGRSDRARGWGYVTEQSTDERGTTLIGTGAYGSMTAGGVGSVVICRSELLGRAGYPRKLDVAAETSIRDGSAWLGRHFVVDRNPAGAGSRMVGNDPAGFDVWRFYFLYALERAGRLAGLDHFGPHDWYGEGATYLVDAQRADGAWNDGSLLDTCFALLFLRRGTPRVARGAVTQALDETAIRFDEVAGLSDEDFEDFIDLVVSTWTRAADDAARGRIARRCAEVGRRMVWPLLRRLEAPEANRRAGAVGVLRGMTGRSFGYDPAREAKDREAAFVAWQTWWLENETTLTYDAESGLLK